MTEQNAYDAIKKGCEDRLAIMTNEELKLCLDVIGIFRYCQAGYDKQIEQVLIEELIKPDRIVKELPKDDR